MSHKILPRSDWTTTREGFSTHLNARTVRGVAIHYPGDGNVQRRGTSANTSRQLLRAYRNWHVTGRGWGDIGYNYAVDQNGNIWSAAGRKKAAHCASKANPYANAYYVGILLIIGNNEIPTNEMISALNWLIRQVNGWYGINEVKGHKQIYGASTACPGIHVSHRIGNGIIGLNGPTSATPPASASSPSTSVKKDAAAKRTYKDGEVKSIQRTLRAMGYYNRAIDDDYGVFTASSVKLYQQSQLFGKLVPDSDWGPVTQKHFTWVKSLQTAMNLWKSSYAKLVVDGDYRTITRRRVLDIQRRNRGGAYKGYPDGVPGPVTCKMLAISNYPL